MRGHHPGIQPRRSSDAVARVKECHASLEVARATLARSEARVRHVTEMLARSSTVLDGLRRLRALTKHGH